MEMIRAAGDTGASIIRDWQLQLSVMARHPPTESRVSLFVSTRERGVHWTGATTVVSR